MHGLPTLAKLNREAVEANNIVRAHNLAAPRSGEGVKLASAPERLATMNKLLDGAKG